MYRTDEMNKIIEYAEETYNLSGWVYEFKDWSPQDVYKAVHGVVRYAHTDDGVAGLCNAKNKTIMLFWKGVRSYGLRRWTLAHEIGHAVHYTHSIEILDANEQEAFADRIASEILDNLGM